MIEHDQNAYDDGSKAARKAIANGVPRWVRTSSGRFGEMIHAGTGLPIAVLSGPANLKNWQQSYAQGFNDEILVAIEAGNIDVDFRSLLMTRDEIQHALKTCFLGTVSTETPTLRSPNTDFTIEIDVDASQRTWICYHHESGGEWPKFQLYDGPLCVALAKESRVLVFETESVYLTRDVMTTQVLNKYLLHS